MLIGELSKQTGISKDTIRFYDKLGLIVGSDRTAGTRLYKDYEPETIERLAMISQGKGLGFTLSEIKQLLNEWEGGVMSRKDQIDILERKIAELVGKKQKLDVINSYLVTKLNKLRDEA
jgi:MerR family transcriptional regulator, copper efflux regulator